MRMVITSERAKALGLLRRAAVLPVQYVTGSCPHVDDNLCERISGRVGKDWLRHVHCRVRRSMWSVIPHLLENGHCQALPNQASPAFSVPRYLVTLVVEPCACKLECAVSPECKSNPNPQTSFQCPLWAKPATCRRSDSAASATHREAAAGGHDSNAKSSLHLQRKNPCAGLELVEVSFNIGLAFFQNSAGSGRPPSACGCTAGGDNECAGRDRFHSFDSRRTSSSHRSLADAIAQDKAGVDQCTAR